MSSPSPATPAPTDLRAVLAMITARPWILGAALVASVALFGWWASRQTRIYRATASIIVEASPPQVLGETVHDVVQVGPGQYYAMQDYIQTQRRVLGSDSLALRTVRRLRLLDLDKPENRVVWGTEPPSDERDGSERLAGLVMAEPILDTSIISVSIEHPDPAQAKRLVDGLVDEYREANLAARDASTVGASQFLRDEAALLRDRLQTSEMALYQFKKTNDLLAVALEDRLSGVTRRIDKLTDALTEVRLKKAARSAEVDALARFATKDPLPPTLGATDQTLANLKKDLADELRRLGELRARYEDAHPLVRQAQAKVAAVESAISREVGQEQRSAEARAGESVTEERKISAQLEEARQEGMRVTRLEIEYNKLKRESEALGKQYQLVQNRTKETELAGKVRENNLRVLDYARLPTVPVRPHLMRAGALAVFLALCLGVLVSWLVHSLDRSLRRGSDVEARLGLPLLGAVPRVVDGGGAGRDLHVAREPQSPAAEALRIVRTGLLFAGMTRPLGRLLVTSAGPYEGKTLTCAGLAVVLAQAGGKVLLVDADLRRPRLAAAFGKDGKIGLTSVLLGTASLDEAIVETGVPNLFLLPSGPVPPNPAELLSEPAFAALFDELGRRFPRVVVDSPPAVLVADPSILAGKCDGVLLVVRARRTSAEQAERARRNLTDAGARIVGVVLNDIDEESGYGVYRYGYGGERDSERLRG